MSGRLERTLPVKPGDDRDSCPLCGIHRKWAGFQRETCGEHYLKPECFVARLEPDSSEEQG